MNIKSPLVLSIITVLSFLTSSCGPSQSAIETAVVETMTAFPTTTAPATARPTSTPSPTRTETVSPTPVRENLGVSLEEIQSIFEDYGFHFELVRFISGETVMRGKYSDGIDVYLTARDSNLVRVDYGIPMFFDVEGIQIPSHGDVVVAVLGEDVYETKFSPWARNKSAEFVEALCFDGILIKSYYSASSDSFELNIMVEQEWDEEIGGCA